MLHWKHSLNNMRKKPFIKLFKTYLGHYFFDVNRNEIVPISLESYTYLKKLVELNQDNVDEYVTDEIVQLKAAGYLSEKRVSILEHPSSDVLKYLLGRAMEKITIQVTQSCNLRCSYCIYSDLNNGEQRSHSAKTISKENARKAVDFIMEHSIDRSSVDIGFYGGEPLIAFDVVKDCILYVEKKYYGRRCTFSMTTNATLLDDEKSAFLEEHNVTLMISIDGPKEIHNIHRRFSADGKGSYDVIMENLNNIKNKYPKLYNGLMFNMVIDPQNDFDKINDISANGIFNSLNTKSSIIEDGYSIEKVVASEDYVAKSEYNLFLAYISKLGIVDGLVAPLVAQTSADEMFMEKNALKKQVSLPEKGAPGGPCIPGQLRLFVNADGDLYPCERVSETSPAMKMGSIDEGVDMESAYKLLNICQLTPEKCRNCWAFSKCTLCAKSADGGEELSAKVKNSFCDGVHNEVESRLKNEIMLMENEAGLLCIH